MLGKLRLKYYKQYHEVFKNVNIFLTNAIVNWQQGITGTTINRENVGVLGNMVCTLDQAYIQNSDTEILEKLKNCQDFTDAQATAMQTVLINGNTKYGWVLQIQYM